jgi:hypothetical protein
MVGPGRHAWLRRGIWYRFSRRDGCGVPVIGSKVERIARSVVLDGQLGCLVDPTYLRNGGSDY